MTRQYLSSRKTETAPTSPGHPLALTAYTRPLSPWASDLQSSDASTPRFDPASDRKTAWLAAKTDKSSLSGPSEVMMA
jgi:hypothetical protein